MSDPTLDTLARFDDRSQWDAVKEGVPIFVPHEVTMRGSDGKARVIKVDEARLRRIAERINAREQEDGVVLVLRDGHVLLPVKDYPQAAQPPIVGYARNA